MQTKLMARNHDMKYVLQCLELQVDDYFSLQYNLLKNKIVINFFKATKLFPLFSKI